MVLLSLAVLALVTVVVTVRVMTGGPEKIGTAAPPARPSTGEGSGVSGPSAEVAPEVAEAERRFTSTSPPRRMRSRRRRALGRWVSPTVVSAGAGVLLAVATGVFPIVLWVESHTVPSGATVQRATVEGYDRDFRYFRSGSRPTGRVVVVDLPDGARDAVALEYRWLWPDEGDTLEVYREDGELRAVDEVGTLYLVGGIGTTLFWTWATLGYLRYERRRRDRRAYEVRPEGTVRP